MYFEKVKKVAHLGGGIELCRSSSCLGGFFTWSFNTKDN